MKPVINFEVSFLGKDTSARELVATVWPVVEDEGGSALDEPVIKSHPILVGEQQPSQGNLSAVELPSAGTYLVDVAFPSGQRTRRTISVGESESYRFLLADKSLVRGAVEAVAPGVFPRVVAAARSLVGIGGDLEVKRLKSRVTNISSKGLRELPEFIRELIDKPADAEVVESVPVAELKYTKLLKFRRADSFAEGYQRSWILVSGCNGDETLVAYPEEWDANTSTDIFRLTVNRPTTKGKGPESKWSTHLDLKDSSYGSVIEYLNRRDTKSSSAVMRTIRAQASKMLYDKLGNPFAAAAGAYLFALGGDPGQEHEQWMDSLCGRFPWLPDGPIALGWKCLRTGRRGSSDWRQARQHFAMATQRGLPYYSIGLHILVDGLTLLSMAEPEDIEIKDMLTAATAVNMACVRSEPFTTLELWRYGRFHKLS